jgi:hypothetical protein
LPAGDFEDACRNIEDAEARKEICLVADSLRLGGERKLFFSLEGKV